MLVQGTAFQAALSYVVAATDALPVLASFQALEGETNLLREVGMALNRQERQFPFGRLLYFIQFVGRPINWDAVSKAARRQLP